MGEMGTYWILSGGDRDEAGLMQMPPGTDVIGATFAVFKGL